MSLWTLLAPFCSFVPLSRYNSGLAKILFAQHLQILLEDRDEDSCRRRQQRG